MAHLSARLRVAATLLTVTVSLFVFSCGCADNGSGHSDAYSASPGNASTRAVSKPDEDGRNLDRHRTSQQTSAPDASPLPTGSVALREAKPPARSRLSSENAGAGAITWSSTSSLSRTQPGRHSADSRPECSRPESTPRVTAGTVVGASDGDTIAVVDNGKTQRRICLEVVGTSRSCRLTPQTERH